MQQVQRLETEDPQAYEELANKKKWTHVQKNTTKAIRDQHLNNNYWNLLNHIPR